MSTIGKNWQVPSRQVKPDFISKVKNLVLNGLTTYQAAHELGVSVSVVRNTISRHTCGVRRLRYENKKAA